ncbi:hypothetical protein LXL04_007574 [Taraxacum kok-saghyz]
MLITRGEQNRTKKPKNRKKTDQTETKPTVWVAKNGLGGRLGARRRPRVEDYPSSPELIRSGQHRSTPVKIGQNRLGGNKSVNESHGGISKLRGRDLIFSLSRFLQPDSLHRRRHWRPPPTFVFQSTPLATSCCDTVDDLKGFTTTFCFLRVGHRYLHCFSDFTASSQRFHGEFTAISRPSYPPISSIPISSIELLLFTSDFTAIAPTDFTATSDLGPRLGAD